MRGPKDPVGGVVHDALKLLPVLGLTGGVAVLDGDAEEARADEADGVQEGEAAADVEGQLGGGCRGAGQALAMGMSGCGVRGYENGEGVGPLMPGPRGVEQRHAPSSGTRIEGGQGTSRDPLTAL